MNTEKYRFQKGVKKNHARSGGANIQIAPGRACSYSGVLVRVALQTDGIGTCVHYAKP